MKTGIYGGTFDPPHTGHVKALEKFISQFSLDKVYVIPSYIPPHKTVKSGVLPNQRFEMAKLAFLGVSEKVEISDIEINRKGKSYTSDTVAFFNENLKTKPYLLCGTDMFLTLDTWHEPEYIFRNSVIVYARRENDPESTKLIEEKTNDYENKYGALIYRLDMDATEISSTDIRKAINGYYRGEKRSSYLRECVPEKVIEFIMENNLYKNGDTNDR